MKNNIRFLTALEFVRDGFYSTIFLIVPFIAKELGFSLAQAGFLQTLLNGCTAFLAIPTLRLSSKYGGMHVLTAGIFLYSLAFVGMVFIQSYWVMIGLFLVAGLGFSFYGAIAPGLLASWVSPETRGRQMAAYEAFGDLGKIVMGLLVTALLGLVGWRYTTLSLGTIALCIFIFYAALAWLGQWHDLRLAAKKKPVSISYLLTHKKLVYALLAGALDQFANSPIYVFLPFLLLSKGVPPGQLGIFTGSYFLGNIIARLTAGRFIDKHGTVNVFIVAEVLMAVLLVVLNIAPTIILVGAAAIALGMISEASDPATNALVAQSVEHSDHFEKAYGLRTTANSIAKIISPLLLGLIADRFGISWAFYGIACAVLLAILPAYKVKQLST